MPTETWVKLAVIVPDPPMVAVVEADDGEAKVICALLSLDQEENA